MTWSLPVSVIVDGREYKITEKCDYRVVLDVICALNDDELTNDQKIYCALIIFYEDLTQENFNNCQDLFELQKEMFRIINGGEEQEENQEQKPRLMDWEYDFSRIAPPISRVLGYDARTPDKFTHWYTWLGAYMEIGSDCTFSTIVSIRSKRAKGKKLEKWEQEFYRENRKLIDLPHKLTAEEEEFLNSDW